MDQNAIYTHQIDTSQFQNGEFVYFLKIGKAIKIGFTTNLQKRIKSFRTATAETIQVLAVFTGPRKAERYLHKLFHDLRITNEFFQNDWLIREFLDHAERHSLRSALKWINDWQEATRRRAKEPRFRPPAPEVYRALDEAGVLTGRIRAQVNNFVNWFVYKWRYRSRGQLSLGRHLRKDAAPRLSIKL